jgi:hypothetical protein
VTTAENTGAEIIRDRTRARAQRLRESDLGDSEFIGMADDLAALATLVADLTGADLPASRGHTAHTRQPGHPRGHTSEADHPAVAAHTVLRRALTSVGAILDGPRTLEELVTHAEGWMGREHDDLLATRADLAATQDTLHQIITAYEARTAELDALRSRATAASDASNDRETVMGIRSVFGNCDSGACHNLLSEPSDVHAVELLHQAYHDLVGQVARYVKQAAKARKILGRF